MVHPLLAAWLLKHFTFYNVYSAGKAYGYHRIYRRLLEANRRLVSNPADRRLIQSNLKQAFLFPSKMFEVAEESHTLAFLQKYATEIVNDIEARAPPFFVTVAKVILGKSSMGKFMDIVDDARKVRPPKGGPPASPSSS